MFETNASMKGILMGKKLRLMVSYVYVYCRTHHQIDRRKKLPDTGSDLECADSKRKMWLDCAASKGKGDFRESGEMTLFTLSS